MNEHDLQLSLCMIARNESRTIRKCLSSARKICTELVVVDTGSTDKTQEISRRYGARVIETPWSDDFSRARNLSVENARGKWILFLDADEYLREEDAEAIQDLIQKENRRDSYPNKAFRLIVVSTLSRNASGGLAYRILRLFPNRPEIRFRWPVHEQVESSLRELRVPIRDTDIRIQHSGYSDSEENRRKQLRNRRILLKQIRSGSVLDPHVYYFLGGANMDLGKVPEALRNFQQCLQKIGDNDEYSELYEGTLVQLTDCLIQLKRPQEALQILKRQTGSRPDTSEHPLRVLLMARIEKELGNSEKTKTLFEGLFRCDFRPRLPAYDPMRVKLEALRFLGEYWQRKGKEKVALDILRLARAMYQEGRNVSDEDLRQLYEDSGVE